MNCKRLALLSGTAARAFAGLAGLTPARVDLMVLLVRYEFSQRELATMLCVSDAVVCRMAQELERLGLIARRTPSYDRRLRLLRLTEYGRARLCPLLPKPARCCSADLHLPADGSRGAQCLGEQLFLRDWRVPLGVWGVSLDGLERCEQPPLGAMRERNRDNPYWRVVRGARLPRVQLSLRDGRVSLHTPTPPSRCSA